jgi:hypothetical protein
MQKLVEGRLVTVMYMKERDQVPMVLGAVLCHGLVNIISRCLAMRLLSELMPFVFLKKWEVRRRDGVGA